MSDGQVRVLMSGVSSCGVALAHLARTCTPDLSQLRKDEENAAAKVVPKATNHLPMSRQSNRAKVEMCSNMYWSCNECYPNPFQIIVIAR